MERGPGGASFPPMTYATLLTATPAEGVLLVTLNRPDAGNSLSTRMAEELLALFTGLGADAGAVRAVVLTGAGGKIFCAGADLKERDGMTEEEAREFHDFNQLGGWHGEHTPGFMELPETDEGDNAE